MLVGVTASSDGTVRRWELSEGRRVRVFGSMVAGAVYDRAVCAVAATADGLGIVTGATNNVATSWTIADGARQMVFRGHASEVRAWARAGARAFCSVCRGAAGWWGAL